MKKTTLACFGSSLLVALVCFGVAQDGWREARADYQWSFPEDHWARRDFKTEWWYFTGHLKDTKSDRYRFGYQFTFFRIGLLPNPPALDSRWSSSAVLMGHAAITDLERERHYFSEVLYRESPLLAEFSSFPESRIAWSLGPPGTKERWELIWNGKGFDFSMADSFQDMTLSLSTTPLKSFVFQGSRGLSPKNDDGNSASRYYSFTRLLTRGEVTVAGRRYEVAGLSWMDKEFSTTFLSEEQVGWDWFSLQFDDHTEWMLFQLRTRAGEVDFQWATEVNNSGEVNYLTGKSWEAQVRDRWYSDATQAEYPTEWVLRLPGEDPFRVVALLKDQENRSSLLPGLNYWEGAVAIQDLSGNRLGRGFVELTGYGPQSSVPGLTQTP